ncbi:TonB-dependent receptor [Massilia eurypsychrophila]|uniref:TonB-dependent receptor n=1 Tax=Massilia eurypsychrophila TaxID=1485217 RepID=A0A2G8T7X7_9BURK|nr:TonB-dependent receptor [Massilia eurypsychrophila]PIL42112.1 TonB-dependent receptor [Massilia eurypsychrophila]
MRRAAMLALLVAQQAAAQDYPTLSMLRVEVVGVAPQPGRGIDRDVLPYPVQSASAKAIRQAQAGNLGEFMARNLSGVNVNEISGSPFQNDVTFRGFRASAVLGSAQGLSVYLDGVRVNEPFGDVVNWDMLPEAAIGSVLLATGSNPLYGLNTLGGALALTTKSGRSDPGFDAELSVGSHGQRRFDVTYGAKLDQHWHALLASTAFDDAGWRDHSAGRLGNLFFKLGHVRGATDWSVAALAGSSRLRGNGLLPSVRWTDDGPRDGLYEDNRRAAYTFPDETRNRLRQLSFNLRHQLGAGAQLSATAYGRSGRRDTVNGDADDDFGDYVAACGRDPAAAGCDEPPAHTAVFNTTSTRQRSAGAALHWSAARAEHKLGAGATFDRNRVSFGQFAQEATFSPERAVLADADEPREPESSVVGAARSSGLYASDTWTVRPGTHLSVSARFNHARVGNTLTNDNGPQPAEAFTYRKLNPAIGIAQEVGAGATVFANIAQSNRVPTVIELGCADPAQPCRLPAGLQSDPFLEQVVSRTMEAGLRWRSDAAALSVSLYRTANTNDILFLSAGTRQHGYFKNFERTRHQGLDFSANGQFGQFDARISYNYLQAVFDADGLLFAGARNVSVTRGTRLAGLPRHTFKLGLDWKWRSVWTFGADAQAISSLVTQGNEDGLVADPEEGAATKKADWRIRGYALLNLRASYRLGRHWELFARINNVANRRYETYGAVATDLFPNGRQLRPQDGPVDAAPARFVAPGAPRAIVAGIRATF